MNTATNSPQAVVDHTDIAYMGIGAATALAELDGRLHDALCEAHGGQLGVVGEIVKHAQLLADVYAEQDGQFPGVWYYDVAEPFGSRFVEALAAGQDVDPAALVRKIVEECE